MMRRLWLAAQVLVVGAIGVFVVRSVGRNWDAIRRGGAELHIDPVALAAAAGIVLATYALLIGAWRAVLLGWGERLRYPDAARIWCLSNLARYVPGRIWQIAGMAVLAQRAGLTPWAAAGSAIIVQLLAVATGALVTGIAAPQAHHPLWVVVSGSVAAAAAAALAWRRGTELFSNTATRLLGRSIVLRPVARGPLLASACITLLAWVAYGLALSLCTAGLLGRFALDPLTAVGVFAGSYLAGLLAVFTPGGLGVRESLLYLWLVTPLGPAGALAVSIGSRLLLTATEVVAAGLTFPLGSRKADAR